MNQDQANFDSGRTCSQNSDCGPAGSGCGCAFTLPSNGQICQYWFEETLPCNDQSACDAAQSTYSRTNNEQNRRLYCALQITDGKRAGYCSWQGAQCYEASSPARLFAREFAVSRPV